METQPLFIYTIDDGTTTMSITISNKGLGEEGQLQAAREKAVYAVGLFSMGVDWTCERDHMAERNTFFPHLALH